VQPIFSAKLFEQNFMRLGQEELVCHTPLCRCVERFRLLDNGII